MGGTVDPFFLLISHGLFCEWWDFVIEGEALFSVAIRSLHRREAASLRRISVHVDSMSSYDLGRIGAPTPLDPVRVIAVIEIIVASRTGFCISQDYHLSDRAAVLALAAAEGCIGIDRERQPKLDRRRRIR